MQILNLRSCFFLLLRYLPLSAQLWPDLAFLAAPRELQGLMLGVLLPQTGLDSKGDPRNINPSTLNSSSAISALKESLQERGQSLFTDTETSPLCFPLSQHISPCRSPPSLAMADGESFFLPSFLLIWNHFFAFLLHWFIHFQIIPVFSLVPAKFPPFLAVLIKNIKI